MTDCPSTCADAALFWFRFGLPVIPLHPETKQPTQSWQKWLDQLSEAVITDHWQKHPEHHLGAIVDERWLVLDADNDQQRGRLVEIESALDTEPNMVVSTRKGVHHWFRRAPGTYARQQSFSTEHEPECIDIKTGRTRTEGRSMVVLPPSAGKDVQLLEADTADELTEIGQEFIDAVFRHNGRQAPREVEAKAPTICAPPECAGEVLEILGHVNAGCGYDQWCRVGMALHDKFRGSDEGLAVYIDWSSKAPNAASVEEIEYKWRSFTAGHGITFASVAQMAADAGADLSDIAKHYHPDGTRKRSFDELIEVAKVLQPEDEVEQLIKDAAHLPPVQKRRVHDVIKKRTGLPLGIIKAQEFASQSEDGNGPPDHLQIAQALADEIGRENVLNTGAFVYQWKGSGVWEKQHERAVKQWVQHHIVGKVEAVAKANVESVTDLFRTEVFKPHHEFDIGPAECVNLLNGELSLVDGCWILEPHKREHYRTTQLPVAYDPKATAPQFWRFICQVFQGDPDAEDKAQAVLEMIGYSMMAHCRHERFVILVGSGANGKSVLLYVLERLLGKMNVSGVQPSQFDNKFQRAHLHGKLANIVSELKQGAVIDDDALKGITSGETTTVEHKHKDPFDLRPFATCWFGTNHLPHTRDFSDALFRRALLIEFNNVFKPEFGNCDPMLKEKLCTELPGILNLALDAYANALATGFTLPASCHDAREKWRLEADQVAQWVDECCTQFAGAEETVEKLFKAYREWADDAGIQHRLNRRSFTDRLARLGYHRGREAGTGKYKFTGICLRHDIPLGGHDRRAYL